MNRKENQFQYIAWVYDFLAKLVFGNSYFKAQLFYLPYLQKNSHVLILGGGTGEILETFKTVKFKGHIDFIEPSNQMLKKAKKRNFSKSDFTITFLQEKAFASKLPKQDTIICNFFLDLFSAKELDLIITSISDQLEQDGKLLVTDFSPPNGKWNQFIFKVMFIFLKITSNISNSSIGDIEKSLSKEFELKEIKRYNKHNIFFSSF